ncbi:MAG: zinc ABC transporter ATP-binding protein AztA [Acidimicrobiia bacterium]|nr:MAG: zinc ABC transporter ATP-binding protein AztA [Acidimicrobiia bacterium]
MRLSPVVTGVGVSFRYGNSLALDASDFVIPEGVVSTLIGPNGSGKSTLLHAIAGLLSPATGSLQVAGEPKISYVLQSTKVNESLPVTVGEVVTMGRYATVGAYRRLKAHDRRLVMAAMERMGVSDLAGRHLHELSGGQRQRVFVAQGIAQEHDVLLLDEPLTGLDLASARAIDDVIHQEQAAGRTVVITTHDLNEAAASDWVLLLSGRVVAAGPPEEVLTLEHLSEAYGQSFLHLTDGGFFIEDPAHRPVPGRHQHLERESGG